MATTISCGVMRGGGRGIRASINGHQFIECGVMRGGGRGVDAKIGSKTTILTVDSWDPDQDDVAIPHGHTVEVNVSAADSEELEVLYDSGAEFLTGTLNDAEVVGDEVTLATSPFTEDFDPDPLADWTQRFTTGSFSVIDDGSATNNILRGTTSNNQGCRTADDGPNVSDVEMRVKYQFKQASGPAVGLVGRITGAGSACRGYECMLSYGDSFVKLRRIVGDGGASNLGGVDLSISHAVDTWYWLAYKIEGSNHYAKWWADGGSEPGSWTFFKSDSVHAGPGDCGVFFDSSGSSEIYWWDDFQAEAIPPDYQTSGDWESGSLDVSAVEHHSASVVSWDETLPTDTTVAVKARWPGGSWLACTNGDTAPGVDYGQDMRAGATRDTLELRVELATTDTSVTPAVGNLRAYFEPGRLEDFEIVVHGVSNTPSDDLDVWGRQQVSAGVEIIAWDDLWARTRLPWIANSSEVVTAAFNYWGNAIDSITFVADEDHFRCGDGFAYYNFPGDVLESGPTNAYWSCLEEWFPMGHAYQWHITDLGIAIHADAYWICGHYQIDDLPGSMLAALPNITDHPGSMLAKAYQLDDHVGMALVQGWRIDNLPGSMLAGVRFIYDHPGSTLTGAYHIKDQPGMVLVYGVNRDGGIFVNVIDDDTYQALLDEGITFG